jgi:hypothetical protein
MLVAVFTSRAKVRNAGSAAPRRLTRKSTQYAFSQLPAPGITTSA